MEPQEPVDKPPWPSPEEIPPPEDPLQAYGYLREDCTGSISASGVLAWDPRLWSAFEQNAGARRASRFSQFRNRAGPPELGLLFQADQLGLGPGPSPSRPPFPRGREGLPEDY
jgi:hypothetical protein